MYIHTYSYIFRRLHRHKIMSSSLRKLIKVNLDCDKFRICCNTLKGKEDQVSKLIFKSRQWISGSTIFVGPSKSAVNHGDGDFQASTAI